MKLLIALLFTLSMSVSAAAKSKVVKYFELGTSLDWNKKTVSKGDKETKQANFTLQATKGYIFKKHWDFSLGLKYAKLAEDQIAGKDVKRYGARVSVKYVFNKQAPLVKHHHKTWMTPYLGVGYQWFRLSPHGIGDSKIVAKTEIPSYILSAGIRCFITKNLAATWDLSYYTGKQVTKNKATRAELSNLKIAELNPSLSFVYFY
ncbi:MAG: porin family protein [Bdellovibrionaceae bacterium]|nr:porin family protein [Pseudobdellovibrionaceae bacterium]